MRASKIIHTVSCHAEGEVGDVIVAGIAITNAATEQLGFHHPENPDWRHISFCQIIAPLIRENGVYVGRNAVAIQPGKLDRSPTGTGCSARMAVLQKRGMIGVGDLYIGESVIGSRFHCRLESVTRVGTVDAVVPSICGRAWITGTHQHMLDPRDPWPGGYSVSDTWPVLT